MLGGVERRVAKGRLGGVERGEEEGCRRCEMCDCPGATCKDWPNTVGRRLGMIKRS